MDQTEANIKLTEESKEPKVKPKIIGVKDKVESKIKPRVAED